MHSKLQLKTKVMQFGIALSEKDKEPLSFRIAAPFEEQRYLLE
jgi:hypothetical protein